MGGGLRSQGIITEEAGMGNHGEYEKTGSNEVENEFEEHEVALGSTGEYGGVRGSTGEYEGARSKSLREKAKRSIRSWMQS